MCKTKTFLMPQFSVNKAVTKTNFPAQTVANGVSWKNSYELNLHVSRLSRRRAYLSFSCGKDSVASFLYMRECECWDEIIPVFYYDVPGLQFVEESLAYYEDVLKTKILRLPSPNTYNMLGTGSFQTPYTFYKIKQYRTYILESTFDESDNAIRAAYNHKAWYFAVGMRMDDGLQRRGSIMQNGGLRQANGVNKFFPVYDFSSKEIADLIHAHNVKLTCDYGIWGRSFDGVQFRFTKDMEKQLPEDYNRVKKLFPLVDVLKYRYSIINNKNLIL